MSESDADDTEESDEEPTRVTGSLYHTQGEVRGSIPREIVRALGIEQGDGLRLQPRYDPEEKAIGFRGRVVDEIQRTECGRQLSFNSSNNQCLIIYPQKVGKLVDLERHVVGKDVEASYEVDPENEGEMEMWYNPPLTARVLSVDPHPDLDPVFKGGETNSLQPSAESGTDTFDSLRLEFPVEYRRVYGFESGDLAGISVGVDDGAFGLMIDLGVDPDDDYVATHTISRVGTGDRRDLFQVTIPVVVLDMFGWTTDTPLKLTPGTDRIAVTPITAAMSRDQN